MSRNSLVTTIVFVAGLGTGFFARSAMGTHQQEDTHVADLAAIGKLHEEGIEATLSQDPKGLIYIWTEDAVRFNQAGSPAVGRQVIQAENKKIHTRYPGFKVLSYVPKYRPHHFLCHKHVILIVTNRGKTRA